ncbi:MAG: hypothetical protein AAGA66_03710 [Bacteroidota bacterium]
MFKRKNHSNYRSFLLLAWITTAFGLFNTSGHVLSATQYVPTQMELVGEQKTPLSNYRLFLETANQPLVFGHSKNYPSVSKQWIDLCLIDYHQSIAVRYRCASKKVIEIPSIAHFRQLKTIPQHSEEGLGSC